MSAWIVSKPTIDVIVQALVTESIVEMQTATLCGQNLWQVNHDSVNYRYREHTECPEYVFEGVEAPLRDVVVAKAARCYGYQSCEHTAWYGSQADLLTAHLIDTICRRHNVDDPHDLEGWDDAPGWDIDDVLKAIA